MAYKFRKDLAILSGALDQEGPITIKDDGGLVTVQLGSPNSGLANGQISGSGDLFVGDDLFTDGVADANVAATDQIFFKTGVQGAMKRDSAGDLRDLFFSVVSGDATVAAGGALTIADDSVEGTMLNTNVADTSTIELSSDTLSVLKVPNAITVDNATLQLNSGTTYDGSGARTISVKDGGVDEDALATSVAGLGLTGGGGSALDVQVSGAIKIASDKLGLTGSFAGIGLSFDGGVDSIASIDLDLNELSGGDIADGDSLAFIDANDSNVTKKESVADLAALFAGAGLGAASSVISVANASNGGIGVQANDIKVDLNDLAAADVDEANDLIAIVDANDSNATRKESIVDFVAAIAGTGLSAASGKLSVSAASGVNALGSGGDADATLTESFNFATSAITDDRTYTLPASAGLQAGDTVHVKLSAVDPGKTVTIARAGSQTIDGVTSIVLESPGTAVSLKYVGSDAWMIF